MERGKHFCGGSKSLTQEISRTTARLGISSLCFLLWLSKEIGRNAYILGAVALPNRTDKLVRHLLSRATESTCVSDWGLVLRAVYRRLVLPCSSVCSLLINSLPYMFLIFPLGQWFLTWGTRTPGCRPMLIWRVQFIEIGCHGARKWKKVGNHCNRCHLPCDAVCFVVWAIRIVKQLNTAFPLLTCYVNFTICNTFYSTICTNYSAHTILQHYFTALFYSTILQYYSTALFSTHYSTPLCSTQSSTALFCSTILHALFYSNILQHYFTALFFTHFLLVLNWESLELNLHSTCVLTFCP